MRALAVGQSVEILCAGGDGLDAARGAKAEAEVPNEDAVLVVDDGPRTLLAVADSHFGHFASHALIERLHGEIERHGIPRTSFDVLSLLPRLVDGAAPDATPTPDGDDSASTLMVVVVDRATSRLYGCSIGDSACFALWIDAGEACAMRLDAPSARYVEPSRARDLDPRRATELEAPLPATGLILVCTDGVHECCYRQPERSIGARHLAELLAATGVDAEVFGRRLGELALAGVDGEPGGQDNLAIAVTRA